MKYYLIEISNGDAKIKGTSIYSYETEQDAIASFHKKLGTAMSSDLYVDDLAIVINDNGFVLKSEKVKGKNVELTE